MNKIKVNKKFNRTNKVFVDYINKNSKIKKAMKVFGVAKKQYNIATSPKIKTSVSGNTTFKTLTIN